MSHLLPSFSQQPVLQLCWLQRGRELSSKIFISGQCVGANKHDRCQAELDIAIHLLSCQAMSSAAQIISLLPEHAYVKVN